MSMIRVENLTFAYPSSYDNIFENVNFQIDTDWKLGFIGRNGKGKTTFLNLLLGKYEYEGKILSSVQFDYFPYNVGQKEQWTEEVLRQVCPLAEQWELLRELSYLDVREDALWRPFSTLSNGEQTKVLLAALFLNEGHFLLIDEPTNHLDTKARETVSAYLKKKKGFILVSHDRCFLDGCVDHILSLNRASIEVQSGNFSSWFENFRRQQELELAQNRKLKKDIESMEKAAQRTAVWSNRVEASKYGNGPVDRGYLGHKAAKMMKRAKSLEHRKENAVREKESLLKDVETADSLKINVLDHHSRRLVSLQDITIDYRSGNAGNCEHSSPLLTHFSLEILKGERIALSGKNGCGKSSLIKLILGEDIPHTGEVYIAGGLKISYISQDTSRLKGDLASFAERRGLDDALFRTVLKKLGLERVQFEKRIEDYSEGQKKKVLLASSLCEPAHLFLWDEPLNFIDIFSRIQLEELLLSARPTMLFVEHDRAFREKTATRIVEI